MLNIHRPWLAIFLLSGAAHAEDCWHGPSGITARNDWMATVVVPPGGALVLNFGFNAAWENEVFVCDTASHRLLAVRGNYSRDRSDWRSPAGGTSYTIAAYHKKVSPEAGDAGSHPWLQSPMRNLTSHPLAHPQQEQYGFNDGGGLRYDNALVTVNYIGDRSPPKPAVAISVNPQAIPSGGSAMLSWNASNANSCRASGEAGWYGAEPLSGTLRVAPRLRGAHVYKLTCSGTSWGSTTAQATLTVQ
jgi:hypothetical protein